MIEAEKYVQAAVRSHMSAVEEILERHLLWAPKVIKHPNLLGELQKTQVVLNDGRCFFITTAMEETKKGWILQTRKEIK